MPPPDKQYITNVYTALKENLPDFYKTPQEFESLMTSDSAYRSKAYAALKDNVEGFDRSPAEFDERIIGKQAPEPVYPKESVADTLLGKVDNKPQKGDMASLPGVVPDTRVEKLYETLPAMKASRVKDITRYNLTKQFKIAPEGSDDYNKEKVNVEHNLKDEDWMPSHFLENTEAAKQSAVSHFAWANKEKPEDVQKKLDSGEYMFDSGKIKVKGDSFQNFWQGMKDWMAEQKLALDIEGAKANRNTDAEAIPDIKGIMSDFYRKKQWNREYGAHDISTRLAASAGSMTPYVLPGLISGGAGWVGRALGVAGEAAEAAGAAEALTTDVPIAGTAWGRLEMPMTGGTPISASGAIRYADVPAMGFSNLASNHQAIWGRADLTEDEKATEIINQSKNAFMIGAAQGAMFHATGAAKEAATAEAAAKAPTAASLLSQYAPTANLKKKFFSNLYNNYKEVLSIDPKHMGTMMGIGAGTEVLNQANRSDLEIGKIPEAAIDMAILDLQMKGLGVFSAGFRTIKDAVRNGHDKTNPKLFNQYSKSVQDVLNNITKAKEPVYQEILKQLDKSPDPNAKTAKLKIETFRNYRNTLPAELSEAAKDKALHILQLKTEAIDDMRKSKEPGIRQMHETKAKSYDALLQKLVTEGDVNEKKEPLLISRFAAPPPPPKEEKPKADEPQYFADGEAISRDDMEQLINTTHDIHLEIKNDPEMTQKLAEKGRLDEVQPTEEAPKPTEEEGAKRPPAVVSGEPKTEKATIEERRQEELKGEEYRTPVSEEVFEGDDINHEGEKIRIKITTNKDGSRTESIGSKGNMFGEGEGESWSKTQTISKDNTLSNEDWIQRAWDGGAGENFKKVESNKINKSPKLVDRINDKYDAELAALDKKQADGAKPVQEQKPLTQSATDLLEKMKADGTSPTGINRSLEKIAADNGIEVTGATRPGDIINALKEKQTEKETPSTVDVVKGVENIGGKPFNGVSITTGKTPYQINRNNEVEVADSKRAIASINGSLGSLYDWNEFPDSSESSITVTKKPKVSFGRDGEPIIVSKGEIVFDAEKKKQVEPVKAKVKDVPPPPISEGLYKAKNEEGRAYKIAQGFKWNGEDWYHPDYPKATVFSGDVPAPKKEAVLQELNKIRGKEPVTETKETKKEYKKGEFVVFTEPVIVYDKGEPKTVAAKRRGKVTHIKDNGDLEVSVAEGGYHTIKQSEVINESRTPPSTSEENSVTSNTNTDAVQKPSPGEVLQREPEEAGSTGSERGGVEQKQQGDAPAGESGASGKENGSPDSGTKEVKKSAIPQPVEEKKAASLASEVKKLPLSHVSGLGMGTNQADGTYISTEKGGNRYDKSGTAQKVKVAISKPIEMTWDGVIELQNELLNKHRDQFEPMDFEMLQVPTGKMGMDDLRTPGVNKLAKMVTEQLKSLGYDSMYMRESATQEGQLVVFDRKNVKFEQAKEKPKSNVQKATEIEDLTEPRDLVLQHFIAGGKIHSSAIVEILGNKRTYPESEKRARIGLLAKAAPRLRSLAHKLMESDPTGRFDERDYKNAIEQVILDHNSTGSMANELVSRYIDAVTSHDLTPEEHELIGKDLERKVHEHVNNLPEAEQKELIKILEKYQRPNGTIDWKTLQEDSDGFDPDILSLSDKAQKHLDEALQKNLEPRQSEHGDTAAENGSSKEGEGEGSTAASEAEVIYEPITNKEKAKELADKWREAAKFIAKGAGGDGTMMMDITAVPRFIISKAIEGAAKIIEASGSVADAIADVRAKLKKFADDNKIKYKEEGLDKATVDLLRKHGMLPEPAPTVSASAVKKAVSSKMTGTRAEKEGLKKQIKDFARGYLKGAKDGTLAGQMAQGKEMAAQIAKLKEKHAAEMQKAATRSTSEKDALALRHAKEIAALEKESQKRVDQATVAAFGLGKEVGVDEGIVTGVKAGVKRGSDIEKAAQEKFAKDVAQYLKGAMFDGKLTESQAKAIARRAAKVGGNMNRMVDFMDYVDKVVDDVHYAEKIAEANKLQKQIRKYSKSDKTFANNVDILNALKRIPINKLQPKDLDTFMQIANEYKASRQTPLTEKGYEPFDTKKNVALLEKIQTQLQIDADNSAIAKAEEMSGVLFLSADEARLMIDAINAKNIDAFMEALNKEKAEQLTHALQQRVKYSQMSIDEALKDTDFTDQFGEHAIKVLRRVADVDLSALPNDKVIEVIRAIDNTLISGTPANIGRIDAMLQIHTNLPELEATTSKHLKHALNKFSEFADDLPILMKAIYGISETVAEFRRMTGWDKTFDGGAKAKTDFFRKVKEYDKFREDNKITNNPDDVLRRGMYGHAIQHEGGTPEEIDARFDNNKTLIKDSIKSYAEAKSTEDLAKRLQGIYDEHFEHAKTLDDLVKHFAADLPDDVKAHGFWEKTYADLQPELKYITEAYHNEFFEGGTINYTPRSYNFTDRQTEEPGAEKMSFNNYVNKPTQNANSITRTVEKNLPAGMALDFNFDYSMLKQFKRAKYDIHTTEGRFMFSEFTKAPESKEILGGVDNKRIITDQFQKAEAVQRGNKAENDVASNVLRDVAGTLRNLSSTAALGGFTAYPKQYVSVAAKTLGTLGKDAGLFFEVQKVPLKDLKILEQTSIIVRGLNQGGTNTGGKDEVLRNTQLVESVGGKALRGVVNLSTKARSVAMLSLEEGDVRVAKRSFLAYYMKYLKDHGVDIKAEDLVTEHERIDKVREQALAYAQQMIDESQVVSNNAMMSDFKRPDGNLYKDMLKGVVVPFNSFSSNTRARLIEDARMLYMGDRAQKKEAWKDLWTSVGEIVAYQSINTFVLQAVVKYPMHWLIDKIFGLEDSSDKTLGDHMMFEWKKFYSNVLKDTVVSGFGNAGEGLFLDSLNQVGWFWHNMTNPTDKTPKHEWMIKNAWFFVYDKVNPTAMDRLGVYGVFGNQIAGTLDDAKAGLTGIGKADNSYYNEASVKDAQGFKQEIEQPTHLVKDVQLTKQEQKFMFWQMCWDIAFFGGLSDADIKRVHDAKEREVLRKENKVTKTNRALYRALRQR